MKTLFLKILIVAVPVFICFEIIYGWVLPGMVNKSDDSYVMRWMKFYNEPTNSDIVCLGSSRVHRHCNPVVIDSVTKLHTITIASAGAKIGFFSRLYKDYIKRNERPKVLVVGIDFTGLSPEDVLPDPWNFIPGFSSSDYTTEMDEYRYIKYHKPLGYFYYKEKYFDIIQNPDTKHHINGFASRDIEWDNKMEDFIGKNQDGISFPVLDEKIDEIFRFMKGEKNKGVQCLGIISPEFNEVWKYEINRNIILQKLYAASRKYDIPVINFSDSSYKLCYVKEYFYNSQHLNGKGAAVFSRDLADSINRYFLQAPAYRDNITSASLK